MDTCPLKIVRRLQVASGRFPDDAPARVMVDLMIEEIRPEAASFDDHRKTEAAWAATCLRLRSVEPHELNAAGPLTNRIDLFGTVPIIDDRFRATSHCTIR